MEPKRILVVCQHFWPELFRINDLCDGFVENGLEVDVLCGEPNYPQGEWFEGYGPFKHRHEIHCGINIYRTFEIKRGKNTNFRILINYLAFPLASIFHMPAMMRKHYDKVFLYSLSPVYMGLAGILIGKLKKVEIITYVLDLWPENLYSVLNIKNKLARKFLMTTSTWFYQKSDKLICLSERECDILQERTEKPAKNFCVIPQCCEKLYETPIFDAELHKRFGTGFNIVFTGNISPAQDFPMIINAAEKLKEENIPINWIIVGDGMSRRAVQDEVEGRGLSDNFFFEGFQEMENIPKYTSIASCLLACLVKSPLLECTIPAKVMSYIASGKPIVLAMDGEANTIINESGCGFAGGAGDVMELISNIKRMYRLSNEERRLMGDRGRELHFQKFERNVSLKKLLAFMFQEQNKVDL